MGLYTDTAEHEFQFDTLQLHVGQEEPDATTGARAVPIYQTASYVFRDAQHAADRFGLADAGNIYGRLTNSTQAVLEERVAALEGGVAALAVASGAAAITLTIQALAQAGAHVVAQKTIYGGTYNLLAHTLAAFGIETTFVNAHDLDEVEAAIRPNTALVYLETLGNPNSDIPNIDAISALAHTHGVPVVVDNTFGTPYLFRPLEHGADIVVHSATKFLGGHGTSLGGIIVDGGTFDWAASGKYAPIAEANPSYHGISFAEAAGPAAFATYVRAILLRDEGPCISPFNAWILLQGVETLSLRLDRHSENTRRVVEYLAASPHVDRVNHPSLSDHPDHALYERYFPRGGASIFTFEIRGGQEAAWKFIDHLKVFSLLANVADVKSLVIHPATTTHSQLTAAELADQGITPSTIRLSIGTEAAEDIIWDLDQAFAAL
ncbi:O-acetylhomoserine aminocarboxypropyltransferase/cysteine synthase family protein [Collinsella stercoris]|uniref:O-acetylhomoserine aminocarboxypropyltransferase/cysteine synthase n=1 Tax=Collinsella stercoris DSM 13279 TaxID=445975 RepID=B6GBA5_9ACTN|nr:O-acetylhomoserine aminocarboxypropyltransferase/cysteine synthase family protein [Collinsella stercoris]EEA90423.1 O-acetylhomoserine aminocarboxypropyltransferase/cysteine synthase [Collinsella stercoris DSM 13279]UEA46318.1 O-acetylhomoserine aminocarboxypropyltransferase/cysteine synthase [Collinsella stercoris DSM 13279]UWP11164.1 O-acetylhomoserine aminocarboxypropyltransferase/cysteine synthase [Collinsella stercoris]